MNRDTTTIPVQSLDPIRLLRPTENAFRNLLFTGFMLASIFYIPLGMADQVGITAFEQNKLAKAKSLFEKELAEDRNDAIALHYLGKIALREWELDEAEDYIEKAQKLMPLNAEVQFDVARIMGEQAGASSIFSASSYLKKTINALKKAIELEPITLSYRQRLMQIYLLAPGFMGGDEELAKVEAKAIAEIDEVQGLLAVARIYQHEDENDKLEVLYTSALQNFPNNAHIFLHQGKYYQSQEKFDLAMFCFKKVLTLQQKNEQDTTLQAALFEIGRNSVLSKSHLDDGIKALQSFIEAPYEDIRPKPWAKYRLGLLLAMKGDKEKSRALYKQAKGETKDKTLLKKLKKELKK